MKTEDLTRTISLLRKPGLNREAHCPDEHTLAAIAAGILPSGERERLMPHISDCDHCVARIGELVRAEAVGVSEPVGKPLLARAARLVSSKSTGTHHMGTRVRTWAAAALVVLGLALLLDRPWDASTGPLPGDGVATAGAEPAVRRIDPEAMRPRITFPTDGLSIDPHGTVVRWTPVSGSLYYDIQLLSDSGEMLWQERVDESAVTLPESLVLPSGREYFLHVDAYLAEARSISSHHVVFSVTAPDSGGRQ